MEIRCFLMVTISHPSGNGCFQFSINSEFVRIQWIFTNLFFYIKLLMVLHLNIYVTYLNRFTQEVTNTTEEITTNLVYLFQFLSSTPNDLYHFGSRRCNIIHCQLRNCSSNLYKDLFDHYLSVSPACRNCNYETYFLNVQHITLFEKYSLKVFLTYILMNLLHLTFWCLVTVINEAIFEYVHEYIKLSKRFI